MYRRIGLAAVVGIIGVCLWWSRAEGQGSRPPKPDPDAGERIFKKNCVNCHGPGGRGDGAAAAKLDPRPADLTSEKTQSRPDGELLETVKFGRPGTAMPGWMGELDERDQRDVVAYIRALGRK